jgi:hypothetical protein
MGKFTQDTFEKVIKIRSDDLTFETVSQIPVLIHYTKVIFVKVMDYQQ